MNLKSVSALILIVLAAAFGGWLYGASGRSDLERARREAVERADLSDARVLILQGEMALAGLNFGDAAKGFEAAGVPVQRVQTAWRETGQAERAGRLEIVLSHLRDAQRLSMSLDASARGAADAALQALASSQH